MHNQNKQTSHSHQENNETIIAETKRENILLGKKASISILEKLNKTLNDIYDMVTSRM